MMFKIPFGFFSKKKSYKIYYVKKETEGNFGGKAGKRKGARSRVIRRGRKNEKKTVSTPIIS